MPPEHQRLRVLLEQVRGWAIVRSVTGDEVCWLRATTPLTMDVY